MRSALLGRLALIVALGCVSVPIAGQTEPPSVPKRNAKIMARSDGLSEATAYKVHSVKDEYVIARALGGEVVKQALVTRKRAYDILTIKDASGAKRDLWFDISSFF